MPRFFLLQINQPHLEINPHNKEHITKTVPGQKEMWVTLNVNLCFQYFVTEKNWLFLIQIRRFNGVQTKLFEIHAYSFKKLGIRFIVGKLKGRAC